MCNHLTSPHSMKSALTLCTIISCLISVVGIAVGIAGEEDYELDPILY